MRSPTLLASCLAGLVLMLAPAVSTAQGPTPPPIPGPEGAGALRATNLVWLRTTLKPAGIALDLPALPDTSEPGIYLVEGGDFSISVEIGEPDPRLTLDLLATVAQSMPQGYRLVSTKKVATDGVDGVERVVTTPDGYQIFERLYLYRNRLYTVQYLADPEGSLSPNAERLLGSLRFMDVK